MMSPAKLERIHAAWRERSQNDFFLFVSGLKVPTQDQGPKLFHEVMADFQREVFLDLAPSLQSLRDGDLPQCQRFWIERTKKASKDGDLGITLLWLLAFPTRPFNIKIGAADQSQANIVKDRINSLLHYNPWLYERVRTNRNWAVGPGGLATMEIIAADPRSAHGMTPDLSVINELSHMRHWEFAEVMASNAAGVARGMMIVATNAGFKGTPSEKWRRNAMESHEWRCHVLDRPAPWTNPKLLADEQQMLPPGQFSRLWYGKWSSGKGDAVGEQEIEVCFSYKIGPLERPEPGWWYVGGLDLGTKQDHAGLVVLGVHPQDRIVRLVQMRGWAPDGPGGEVPLTEVMDEVYRLHRTFRLSWLGYDPYQCVHAAQQARSMGVPMMEVPFTASNLQSMATAFVQALGQRWLQCWDDAEGTLRRDFGKFSIVEKQYGVRLEATRDEYGHADVGTALLIALLRASQLLKSGTSSLQPDDDLIYTGQKLTEDDWQAMPEEFREMLGGDSRGYGRGPRIPSKDLLPDWALGEQD